MASPPSATEPKRFSLTAEAAEEDEIFPVKSRNNGSSESERFFPSLNEGRTYRVWLCDLGDLRGEKSG
jgi:hypothetical protein